MDTSTEFGHQVYTDHGITYCTACHAPVRYSTAYDEPHYVHVRIVDTVACPMYASAR